MVKILRVGQLSPMGVLLAGILIGAAGMPAVKRGLRVLAVSGIGAALAAEGFVKNAITGITRNPGHMTEDAGIKNQEKTSYIKQNLREAGVSLASAGMAAAGLAREKLNSLKENVDEKIVNTKKEMCQVKTEADYNRAMVQEEQKRPESIIDDDDL